MTDRHLETSPREGAPGDDPALRPGSAAGEPLAETEFLEILYDDLRRSAHHQLRGRPDHWSLRTTGLANDACMRLLGGPNREWKDRHHFLRAAARAMRHIVVDYARARRAQKRGGDERTVMLEIALDELNHRSLDALRMNDAIEELETFDPDMARLAELLAFGGCSMAEAAEALRYAKSTLEKRWSSARTWLFLRMR